MYVFFFIFFSIMVDYKILNMLYSRTLFFIRSVYKFASANPHLPIHPSPVPSPRWQPQVCSLCLCVCFCFVDKFICIIV